MIKSHFDYHKNKKVQKFGTFWGEFVIPAEAGGTLWVIQRN